MVAGFRQERNPLRSSEDDALAFAAIVDDKLAQESVAVKKCRREDFVICSSLKRCGAQVKAAAHANLKRLADDYTRTTACRHGKANSTRGATAGRARGELV